MKEVRDNPLRTNQPLSFSVIRVPFFLEPEYDTSEEFEETNRTRLVRKWGGQTGWDVQKRRHGLKERGQEVGIMHFNLDRIASSTLASHRLVQWITKTHGQPAAEKVYHRLNHSHFELGRKLNDNKLLVEAAMEAGVAEEAAQAFLASSEGLKEIQAAQKALRKLGINSIPTFIIGGEFAVSGAADKALLVQHFRDIERTGKGLPGTLFTSVLGIPQAVVEEPLELDT